MTAVPTWFGAPGRPLLGFVHAPGRRDGTGGGGHVQPPRAGGGQRPAGHAGRADRSGRRTGGGRAAVRLWGTGDSAGSLDDPERLVRLAGQHRRGRGSSPDGPPPARSCCSGCGSARSSPSSPCAGARPSTAWSLWDPCARRSRSSSGSSDAAGHRLRGGPGRGRIGRRTRLHLLARRRWTSSRGSSWPTLTLEQGPDRGPGGGARSRARGDPVLSVARGPTGSRSRATPNLLDLPPQMLTLPATTIKTIADWASSALDGRRPVPPGAGGLGRGGPRARSRSGPSPSGPVRLGPNSLFGVVTEAGPARPPDAPRRWCSSPPEPSTTPGPGRMWVELARRLAGRWPPFPPGGHRRAWGRRSAAPPGPDHSRSRPRPSTTSSTWPRRSVIRTHGPAGLRRAVLGRVPRHRGRPPAPPLGRVRHQPGDHRLGPRPGPRDHRPPTSGLPCPCAAPADLSVKHARMARWWWRAGADGAGAVVTHPPRGRREQAGHPVLVIVSELDVRRFEPRSTGRWSGDGSTKRGLLDIEVVPARPLALHRAEGQRDAYPHAGRVGARPVRTIRGRVPVLTASARSVSRPVLFFLCYVGVYIWRGAGPGTGGSRARTDRVAAKEAAPSHRSTPLHPRPGSRPADQIESAKPRSICSKMIAPATKDDGHHDGQDGLPQGRGRLRQSDHWNSWSSQVSGFRS